MAFRLLSDTEPALRGAPFVRYPVRMILQPHLLNRQAGCGDYQTALSVSPADGDCRCRHPKSLHPKTRHPKGKRC
jgi:hypothetical protein